MLCVEDTKRVVRAWLSLFTRSSPGALLLFVWPARTGTSTRQEKETGLSTPRFSQSFSLLCMPGETFLNSDKPSWQVMVLGTGKIYAQNED